MAVAYTAPTRHGCLKVVENDYCASKRGMSLILSFGLVFAYVDLLELCDILVPQCVIALIPIFLALNVEGAFLFTSKS